MADSMIIGLELQNLQTVLAGLKQVAAAVGAIQGIINKAAKNGGVFIQNATISSLAITGSNVTINARLGAPRAPRKPPKPPATFTDKLKALLMSSRFGSNGLMPLVSKAVDLLGFEAVAAAAAIKLMWMAANDAAEALNSFRGAGYTSGGSGSEVAGLQSYGSVLGRSVQDMADLSRALNKEITSSGVAMGFANKAGFKFNFEPFGSQDFAGNLLKNIKAIRDVDRTMGRQNALQILNAIGPAAESLKPFLDITDNVLSDMERAKALTQSVNNPGVSQDALVFSAQLGILKQNFESLGVSLGGRLIPFFTVVLEYTNSLVIGLTNLSESLKFLDFPLRGFVLILQSIYDLFNADTDKIGKSLIDDLKKFLNPDYASASDPHVDALNRNTDATNANTSAMTGMFGGGPNGQRALPRAWVGNGGQSDNFIGHAQSLGAMGI